MRKQRQKKPQFGRGQLLEVRVIDRYNSRDTFLRGCAPADKERQLKDLLRFLRQKGVAIPHFK